MTGWTYCPPPCYSSDSVICADLWSRQSGPDASCDRHQCGVGPVSLDYGGYDPLLLRYAWWSSQGLEAGLTSRPLLALPGLCLMPDLQSRQPAPEASSDRHSVASALSSSFRLLQTPCYSGMLGGLFVLVGSLTFPSPGRLFEPSSMGRLLCFRLG